MKSKMTLKDLNYWKKSIKLLKEVYEITSAFPDSEKFSLSNQIRRCSVSITSNIAEGAARNSSKEFLRFLYFSHGSSAELHTQLIISKNLNLISENHLDMVLTSLKEISRMIFGLIKSIENKTNSDQLLREDFIKYRNSLIKS